jgi:hypothetical protein
MILIHLPPYATAIDQKYGPALMRTALLACNHIVRDMCRGPALPPEGGTSDVVPDYCRLIDSAAEGGESGTEPGLGSPAKVNFAVSPLPSTPTITISPARSSL